MQNVPYGPRQRRHPAKKPPKVELDFTSRPRIALIGWVLVLGGAVCLVVWLVPQWRVTTGHGFLTFREHPPSSAGVSAWLPATVIVGPVIGLNVIFGTTSNAHRRAVFAVVTAVLTAELLAVLAAIVWAVGAGLPYATVVAPSGSDDAVAALLFILGVCAFAAAMLGFASTGRLDPALRSFGIKLVWLVVLTLLWVLGMVPAWLSSSHALHWGGTRASRPWPAPWTGDDGGMLGVTITLYLLLSIPLGTVLSMVVKELVYRGPMRAYVERSGARSGFGWAQLRFFQHWPIVVAVLVWASVLGTGIPDVHAGTGDGSLLGPALLALVPFGLGLLLILNVWRAQDLDRSDAAQG